MGHCVLESTLSSSAYLDLDLTTFKCILLLTQAFDLKFTYTQLMKKLLTYRLEFN
jgi:hypothetical protein